MSRIPALRDLPELRRPHFFPGRLLTETDLTAEQEYHRERSRLQNRLLHGWGVVDGLDVRSTGGRITVSPGVAIDPSGDFVFVRDECELLVPPSPVAKASCFVVVHYSEVQVNPMPMIGSGSGDSLRSGTIIEGATCSVQETLPRAADAGIAVARLIWRSTQWRVDARYRRRKAR